MAAAILGSTPSIAIASLISRCCATFKAARGSTNLSCVWYVLSRFSLTSGTLPSTDFSEPIIAGDPVNELWLVEVLLLVDALVPVEVEVLVEVLVEVPVEVLVDVDVEVLVEVLVPVPVLVPVEVPVPILVPVPVEVPVAVLVPVLVPVPVEVPVPVPTANTTSCDSANEPVSLYLPKNVEPPIVVDVCDAETIRSCPYTIDATKCLSAPT